MPRSLFLNLMKINGSCYTFCAIQKSWSQKFDQICGGRVTTSTAVLDVLPGFVRVTILGLAVMFGKCPVFLLSEIADSQFQNV